MQKRINICCALLHMKKKFLDIIKIEGVKYTKQKLKFYGRNSFLIVCLSPFLKQTFLLSQRQNLPPL